MEENKERVRVAGVILMEGGIALMHRKDVKKRPDMQEYYTFPGGGIEETDKSYEDGVIREIKEEFGIDVKVIKKLYKMESKKFNQKEIFYLCEYIGGKFGTGNGPEFSNNPKYIDSGKYIPEIVPIEEICKISLMPTEAKEAILKKISKNTCN